MTAEQQGELAKLAPAIHREAQEYLARQDHGGMLVEVIDIAARRCFESDGRRVQPREPDVLRLVAAALMLAEGYGYTLDQIQAKWQEWEWQYPGPCCICGQDHDREYGCPPQEPKPR